MTDARFVEGLQYLDAGHSRHQHVHDDQVWRLLQGNAQSLLSIACDQWFIAVGFQHVIDNQIPVDQAVICHQHSFTCHANLPRSYCSDHAISHLGSPRARDEIGYVIIALGFGITSTMLNRFFVHLSFVHLSFVHLSICHLLMVTTSIPHTGRAGKCSCAAREDCSPRFCPPGLYP